MTLNVNRLTRSPSWHDGGRRRTALSLARLSAVAVVLAASTGVAVSQVPFAPEQLISDSNSGVSPLAVDLDRDGDADLVVSVEVSNEPTTIWHENRLDEPSADFGPAQTIGTGGGFQTFAVDFDRDGDMDVLEASRFPDNEIYWFENRLDEGSADFGPKQTISTNVDLPRSVYAIDLDGDGDADALSASRDDDKIAWYENRLNEASGDFGSQQVISTAADGPTWVIASDLDGDGDADVLSVSTVVREFAWYENRLDEVSADFGPKQVIYSTSNSIPCCVLASDIDGDGDADVLSVGTADQIAWHENRLDEASADFGPEQVISTAVDDPRSAFVIDLDHDGDADVLSASLNDNKIAWYENRLDEPSADFAPQQVISTSDGASRLAAVDLDQDGDADVISTGGFASKIVWYENRLIHRSADFSAGGNFPLQFPKTVAAGDVDRDGDDDLFVARSQDLDLYRTNGVADFAVSTISGNVFGTFSALDPADLDRDGDLDLLAAGGGFSTGVFWYENATGDGTGSWPKATISTTSTNDVHSADLDGDGDLDALFASGTASQIGWHENRLDEASADFAPALTISTAVSTPRSVFAGDLDRDGDLDVLSASSGDDKIAWYENTGGGSFQPQQIVITTAAAGARSVSAADLDGDGDLDVLAAAENDGTVAWYANDGTGVFSAAMTIDAAADLARSVRADDVDCDGDLDVVSASANGTTWYENTSGDGSTWTARAVDTTNALNALTADLDVDGAPDLVSVTLSDPVSGGLLFRYNWGGQFSTRATDTAQGVVSNGQLEDVFAIEVVHLGRAGDTDVELASLEIRLLDTAGVPLASAQANALIDTVRLYRDDGSGKFEESGDLLVSTLSSFSLVDGYQTIPVVDDDPNAAVAYGSPATFFVTFEMTANAEAQPVAAFRVTHLGDNDEAEDAGADFALTRDPRNVLATAEVDTALTDATCRAPLDLNLENRTIDTTLTCEAGTQLLFGSSTVTASGILTLRAGSAVEIEDASGVAGQLAVEIDPSLLPP